MFISSNLLCFQKGNTRAQSPMRKAAERSNVIRLLKVKMTEKENNNKREDFSAHFDTMLTSAPDFTGRLYQHRVTNIMKIEFEIIVKYRACYPLHATAWTKHGDFFQHNARFSNFMEQRVRMGPDAYASILTFEVCKGTISANICDFSVSQTSQQSANRSSLVPFLCDVCWRKPGRNRRSPIWLESIGNGQSTLR